MALPTNIGYTTVTGRFIRAILDGMDTGRDPDGIPIAGLTITFTANINPAIVRNPTASPPVTIMVDPIQATTNSDGVLIGPDGNTSILLVSSDDEDLDPHGWTYSVRISGSNIATSTFSFVAPFGGTVDLGDVIPVPASPGAALVAWQATVTTVTTAKDQAIAARDEVVAIVESGIGGAVDSVNGYTGVISLSASDIGAQPAGSYATSSALTSGLAGKQDTGDYATNTALTSGLAGKQASGDYATNTALSAKAPLASPAFTGTPTGITKTHVGLGNVDNTADTAKPVSTAQQTALDAKVATSLIPANLGPTVTADKLITIGALSAALGYWLIPIVYNTGTSTWPSRTSVVPAWFTGWAYWHALSTVDVANPADLATNDVVVDQHAS